MTQGQEPAFIVYPAIDVREGHVVRLVQGDYARETRYPGTPIQAAAGYAADGATWLHLVDLDAAKAGGYTLGPLLRRISDETGLKVQTGGGVRNETDVEALLEGGADRVVIGSLAVRAPDLVLAWMERFGADRFTIALDARESNRRWTLPIAGWTEDSDVDLLPLVNEYANAGMRHLLSTDIGRDGMMAGPNTDLYQEVVAIAPGVAVQASGGVRDVADVLAARDVGCAGAIIGKTLLDGRLELADALAAVKNTAVKNTAANNTAANNTAADTVAGA